MVWHSRMDEVAGATQEGDIPDYLHDRLSDALEASRDHHELSKLAQEYSAKAATSREFATVIFDKVYDALAKLAEENPPGFAESRLGALFAKATTNANVTPAPTIDELNDAIRKIREKVVWDKDRFSDHAIRTDPHVYPFVSNGDVQVRYDPSVDGAVEYAAAYLRGEQQPTDAQRLADYDAAVAELRGRFDG